MKLKKTKSLLFFFGIIFSLMPAFAQELADTETDDLGNVSDAFQENFFEALKQKGIENYELALDALRKAEKAALKNPKQEAIVFFEMGKNFAHLRRYEEAEDFYNKVLQVEKDRLDVQQALYDVYYKQRNYEKAIPLVKKLAKRDKDYKEDLSNLLYLTKKYDEALSILDEIDEEQGENSFRNSLRNRIYQRTGNKKAQITKLEGNISSNPKKEQDYINLIYLYSQEGNTEKAFKTAKELLKNNPKSIKVHLALYKFYLDDGDIENAMSSMQKVLMPGARDIKKEDQFKVLSDFIGYVTKNPQYEAQLETTIAAFSSNDDGNLYEKIGAYYLAKNNRTKALVYYEKGIEKDPDNFSLLKNTLLLQIEEKKFDQVVELSNNGLEIFPAQPILYLMNGVANNSLKKTNDAIEVLETGIDYVFDNPVMEKDFYTQLQLAYQAKGDSKKAASYASKAAAVNLPN